ncbi:MAG TPA: DUF1848 family protein [Caldithrix abyssi]|uniref:DUF1848 family protein n=1 Tax=Caldithrix abyssi TaxID=187145 RepID=A0A7V4U218_CALAY|nr:DUF1848 family protein [Caldithrix abyssi]
MKQVISASRRTDIPAYCLKWFMEQIREGFADVHNPFYRGQVRRVSLLPDDVEWIVFWSRNYRVFLKHYAFFTPYNLFFHFTILPKSALEKSGLSIPEALYQMERLAALYGPERIIWRYDPLVYWEDKSGRHTNYNPEEFESLCREVAHLGVQRCYFSFAHPYGKLEARFRNRFTNGRLLQKSIEEQKTITARLNAIAAAYNITLFSCCNDALLAVPGVAKGRCIDGDLLNSLASSGPVSRAKTPTRQDCGCSKSVDIGDYVAQPCPTGCLYCYANPVWR